MTHSKHFETHAPTTFNDAELVGMFPPDSPEWHEARKSGIGGSDIGTIVGVNPWDSAFALWARRTGQLSEREVSGWAVRFGKAFEEPILQMWQEEHPEYEVFQTGTYRSKKHRWQLANVDALARHKDTGEWLVVEVKTSRMTWNSVPPMYLAQVQMYMDVLGISRAVVVGVVGWSWEERFIEADAFEQEALRAAGARFWDHLTKEVAPAWDGSKATYEAVRELHPDIEDDDVDLGELGEELLQAQKHLDEAERWLNELKSQILDTMGKAKTGVVHRGADGDSVRVRVASRQARGQGKPWLVVHRERD